MSAFAPLALPDHQFATLAWLKKPMSAPDLPRNYVIADALAALNPPPSLWRDYVREIVKLESTGRISTNDYYRLRYSRAAREALLGLTLGGTTPFLEGSVPEILARARAAERADVEAQLEGTIARWVQSDEKGRAEIAQRDARIREIGAESQEQIRELQRELEVERQQREAEKFSRLRNYKRVADLIASAPRVAAVAIYIWFAAIQAYALLPWQPISLASSIPTHPALAILAAGILGVEKGLSLTGSGLIQVFGRFERRASKGMVAQLARTFEPEQRNGSA